MHLIGNPFKDWQHAKGRKHSAISGFYTCEMRGCNDNQIRMGMDAVTSDHNIVLIQQAVKTSNTM